MKRDIPGDVARRLAERSRERQAEKDTARSFRRQTFILTRTEAREKAREWFSRYPKAAYMTEVESWRELGDGRIEFTMRRLPSAD